MRLLVRAAYISVYIYKRGALVLMDGKKEGRSGAL